MEIIEQQNTAVVNANALQSLDKPKIRYANASNLHVSAIINGAYRFDTAEAARKKLDKFKSLFTVSREQEENPATPSLILWIKNYDVSEEERGNGFVGNFAVVRVEMMEDSIFTLTTTKLATELRYHPMRKSARKRCPNWGHPILREIQRGATYPTIEAVNAVLEKLHLEYPETTIPAANKLYVMIFSRKEDPKNPISKHILEIKNLQGGGFTIACSQNNFTPNTRRVSEVENEEAAPPPMGHFSSLIALKRNKKTDK